MCPAQSICFFELSKPGSSEASHSRHKGATREHCTNSAHQSMWLLEALLTRPRDSGESQTVARLFTHSLNLRAVTLQGAPWFRVADVCAALGIRNTGSALVALHPSDKSRRNLGLCGQAPGLVNESELCDLVFKSRKPEA